MTLTEKIITIGAVVFGTMITRFLPFLIFPDKKHRLNGLSNWVPSFLMR